MSCGNPHDVDCVEILRRADIYLSHDLEDLTCAEIRQHLAECEHCLHEYKPHEEFSKLIERCCGGEVASSEFKQRLRVKLAELQIEVTSVEVRDL